jgi:hypothetical protein
VEFCVLPDEKAVDADAASDWNPREASLIRAFLDEALLLSTSSSGAKGAADVVLHLALVNASRTAEPSELRAISIGSLPASDGAHVTEDIVR